MFLFFSIHQFQEEATDITSSNSFGLEYQDYFWNICAKEWDSLQNVKKEKPSPLLLIQLVEKITLYNSPITTRDTYLETVWEKIKIVESIGQPNNRAF